MFYEFTEPMPTLVQPFPMRSTVSDYEGRLKISIPLEQFGKALFVGLWLCLWTYGGVAILKKTIEEPSFFEILWLGFWATFTVFTGYVLLLMLGGTDVVVVDQHSIVIRREVFGVGISREYLTSEMRDLRFQPEMGTGRSHRDSRIAFDYGAKTITFGDRLDEAEGNQLITLIGQRCRIALTPPAGSAPYFWQSR